MGKIVLLDELTINQIAAGEVIERPASVIKEMVENSIDAGATNISVEIRNGGISYIRITDNGKGIAYDDMEIAFERHATSKIRQAEDLNTVKSMGFRGEALASIAAIASVEMVSKTEEESVGHKIIVEGGNVVEFTETGCPTGTTITVQNLFFNTPVRYKFLKKDYTESGYIEDIITRLALANPNIAFKLVNSGKCVIQTSGNGELQDAIYRIYGKDVARDILNVNYTYNDIKITGVIGKPEIARSNRSNQLFFVNKRYVKDKTLSSATEKAYKDILQPGKYAFLVLNIEINPINVDVNVHPAKLEVRFSDENEIFKAIYHAIKDALVKENIIKSEELIHLEDENINNKEINKFSNLFKKIEMESEASMKRITENLQNLDLDAKFNKLIESLNSNKQENTIEEKTEIIENNIEKTNVEESKIEEPEKEIPNEEKITDTKNEQFSNIQQLINKSEEIQKEITQKENTEIEDILAQIIPETKEKIETFEPTVNLLEEKEDNNVVEELKDDEEEIPSKLSEIMSSEETKKKISNIYEIISKEDDDFEKMSSIYEVISNRENKKEDSNLIENIESVEEQDKIVEEIPQEEIIEKLEDIQQKQEQEIEEQDKVITELINDNDNKEENTKIEETENVTTNNDIDFKSMYEKIFGREIKKEETTENSIPEEINANNIISVFEDKDEYKIRTYNYKYIGIVFEDYIIIEIEKELYIVNQKAINEKIMYENIKRNFYSETEKDSQMLLLPDIIELNHKEMEIAKDNFETFEKAGFTLEEFGENTIKLSGAPNICIKLDTKELFRDILGEINTVARTEKSEIEEKFIQTVARKVAERLPIARDDKEAQNIVEELLELPNPFTGLNNKTIAIRMNIGDIEKKFARRS